MKFEKNVKRIVIILVITAILVALISAAKVYSFSINSPRQYEYNYSKLSQKEKKLAKGLKKAGKAQSKIIGKDRGGGNGKFIDEVSKSHKNDKKKEKK